MTIIEFVKDWKDLIVKVFTEDPLAGALGTLLAIGGFIWLQREKKFPLIINLFFLLLGWSIIVPLFGLIFDIIKWVFNFLKFISEFISSVYGIYAQHPLVVIILIVLAVIAGFIWRKKWPDTIRNKYVRVAIIIICTIVIMFIISPLVDVFTPDKSSNQPADKELVDSINSKSTRILN